MLIETEQTEEVTGASEFELILREELIPQFCETRPFEPSEFRWESVRVSELDARDFVRAWRARLLRETDRPGLYRACKSAASEQFFWSGRKLTLPRSFRLWLEPLITAAAAARLHFDYCWPVDLIGCQSADWAFDLVAYSADVDQEFIVGEVKKSVPEVDVLLALMQQFGRDAPRHEPPLGRARNAYKKVCSLRATRAPLFWAIGPSGYSKVFTVNYADSSVSFVPSDEAALLYAERG